MGTVTATGRPQGRAAPTAWSRAASRGCSRGRACPRQSSSTSFSTVSIGARIGVPARRRAVSASAAATKLLSQFDTKRANELVREALAQAGIVVGGPDPWDIVVNDERFYQRILRDGTLGFGESYMD